MPIIVNDHPSCTIHGDTTSCAKCGKSWDTNDFDPPPCVTVQNDRQGRQTFERIKNKLFNRGTNERTD